MKLSDSFGQEIDFKLDPAYKKIGINLSGGADSSILFYILCDYLKKNNLTDVSVSVMTCANDLKHRWNVRKAADVINYTIDRLDFNPVNMHYAYYRDQQEVNYFHEVERSLFDDGRVDMFVSGITANPWTEANIEDSNGDIINLNETGLGERNTGNSKEFVVNSEGFAYYTPFVNVDKRFVAAMYNHYGVTDSLLSLTRSCEAIPPGKFDPNFEHQPCGKCWWCLERKWAFGQF